MCTEDVLDVRASWKLLYLFIEAIAVLQHICTALAQSGRRMRMQIHKQRKRGYRLQRVILQGHSSRSWFAGCFAEHFYCEAQEVLLYTARTMFQLGITCPAPPIVAPIEVSSTN